MTENKTSQVIPFYDQPQVQLINIPLGSGIPFGFERISNPEIGIGGVYGTWGTSYDNETLPELIEKSTGSPLDESERMNLAPLGFVHRHHVPPDLPEAVHIQVETEVGAHLLKLPAGIRKVVSLERWGSSRRFFVLILI